MTALALLRRFWPAIPIVLALITFSVLQGQVSGAREERDAYRQKMVQLTERLNVTTASLNGALAQIGASNRRIAAAAAELEKARGRAAADQARADERWRATKGTVDALTAEARRTDRDPCVLSQSARAALEKL